MVRKLNESTMVRDQVNAKLTLPLSLSQVHDKQIIFLKSINSFK